MSEVSTWNATDNANTDLPPDGWPEGQMPATVNDCGRMMMGALRREHDRVVAQVGSVAGTISTTNINATNISASGAIAASGSITGGSINSLGNASVSGALAVSGTVGASLGHFTNATIDGTITVGVGVNAPLLYGGPGGAGDLAMWGSGDKICFRWGAMPTGGNQLFARINETGDFMLPESDNVTGFRLVSGVGGPTGVALGMGDTDNGNSFYIFSDFVSDERIKDNINQTGVDALAVLRQVPVSQFDINGRAAAWLQTIGKGEEDRNRVLADPQPVHVEIGFVAQQVQRHIPEAVAVVSQNGAASDSPLPSDLQTIIPQNFVPYLVRAVQQLAARVEELESRGA